MTKEGFCRYCKKEIPKAKKKGMRGRDVFCSEKCSQLEKRAYTK